MSGASRYFAYQNMLIFKGRHLDRCGVEGVLSQSQRELRVLEIDRFSTARAEVCPAQLG